MDAVTAIRDRRMRPRVTDERPSRDEIEELLDLACRAPNHHRTEPWRFIVLTGEGIERVARAIAAETAEDKGGSVDDHLEFGRAKAQRAPVIVVVTCRPSDEEKVVEQEEVVSAAMAMQNILLACEAKGLGVMLRTGTTAYREPIRRELELDPEEKIVGMLYLGYPAADRDQTPREPAKTKTRWVGWD